MIHTLREFVQQEEIKASPISVRSLFEDYGVDSMRGLFASYEINTLYRKLGGRYGRLGGPQGAIISNADGSFTRDFELGRISQQGETPAAASTKFNVRISIAGTHCYGTDDPSGQDETYLIATIIILDPLHDGKDSTVSTIKLGPRNTNAGDTFWQGNTLGDAWIPSGSGIQIHLALWDQEQGDPEEIRKKIEGYIKQAAQAAAAAIGGAVEGGEVGSAGAVGDKFRDGFINDITLGLSGVIANMFSDDFLGEQVYVVESQRIPEWFEDTDRFLSSFRQENFGGQIVSYNVPVRPQDIPMFEERDNSYMVFLKAEVVDKSTPLAPPNP